MLLSVHFSIGFTVILEVTIIIFSTLSFGGSLRLCWYVRVGEVHTLQKHASARMHPVAMSTDPIVVNICP